MGHDPYAGRMASTQDSAGCRHVTVRVPWDRRPHGRRTCSTHAGHMASGQAHLWHLVPQQQPHYSCRYCNEERDAPTPMKQRIWPHWTMGQCMFAHTAAAAVKCAAAVAGTDIALNTHTSTCMQGFECQGIAGALLLLLLLYACNTLTGIWGKAMNSLGLAS